MRNEQDEYTPGMKVLIAFNSHRSAASNVIGTVLAVRTGEGFLGYDAIDVEFTDPSDDSVHQLPFGAVNLRALDTARLIVMAKRHEARAAELRLLAKEAGDV